MNYKRNSCDIEKHTYLDGVNERSWRLMA